MRRTQLLALVLCLIGSPLAAQGLRDKISQLFIFGEGRDPLFLAGTADPNNPASLRAHAEHFIPSAVQNNSTLISFLQNAIATNVANIPLGATSSGITFRLVGGNLVPTSRSPGPIFAERYQTLGRGRVFVAANINAFNLKKIRGVNLDNIRLNFTHVNADFPGCDTVFGGDCSQYGLPGLENDFIQLNLDLNMSVTALSFLVTFGLLDRLDFGVALPLIFNDLRGTATAQVVPFGGPTAAHFFGGTPDDPQLSDTRFVEGSASGIGDVAARLKLVLTQSETTGFALLADGRFPTGSEEDLLGSGEFAIRGLGIVSASFGPFSPHANFGYVYRTGDLQTDAVLATLGFDHVLAPWATLAADLVSEFQVGDNKLEIPETVQVETPFRRSIEATTIPVMRDDIVNASFGFKFVTRSRLTIVANSLWPLNDGGVRPDVLWTAGLEFNF